MIPDDHPIVVLGSLRADYGDDISLQFSSYEYVPQTVLDVRDSFEVNICLVTKNWVREIIENLPEGRELALHSLVKVRGKPMHIPMVDFATRGRAQLPKLYASLDKEAIGEMLWFDSGRSFHGYGTKLLESGGWVKFMGRLLLANQISAPPLIDPRWVGHRLIAGYSALRWSKKTSHYIQIAKLISDNRDGS